MTKKLKCSYITAVTRVIISVTNVRPTVCFPHSLHNDLRSHLEIEHGTSRTEDRARTNCTSPCSNLTLTSLHFILHYISTNKSFFIYLFIYLLIVRSCPPLVEVAGTSVSPKDCLIVGARKVKDTCTFSCKEGYKLPDPNQPTLTCLDTGAWDKAVINCQRE